MQSAGFAAQHLSILTSTAITKHHFPLGVILYSPMIHARPVDLAPHPFPAILSHPKSGVQYVTQTTSLNVFPSPQDWFKDKHMTQSDRLDFWERAYELAHERA